MSALAELQVALIARLKADAGVAALVGVKVFENVAVPYTHPVTGTQVEPELPWVTVDSLTGVEEGNAFERSGYGHTASVHAFGSDAEGNKQVLAVAKAVKAALKQPLTLQGHSSTRLRLEFETILPETSGTRHVPMRFRTWAMETA